MSKEVADRKKTSTVVCTAWHIYGDVWCCDGHEDTYVCVGVDKSRSLPSGPYSDDSDVIMTYVCGTGDGW